MNKLIRKPQDFHINTLVPKKPNASRETLCLHPKRMIVQTLVNKVANTLATKMRLHKDNEIWSLFLTHLIENSIENFTTSAPEHSMTKYLSSYRNNAMEGSCYRDGDKKSPKNPYP